MTDRKREEDSERDREGFGDDQGTRVGRPTPQRAGEGRSTGAGAEATEGMHAADGARDASDRTALEGKETGRGDGADADRSGSEPQSSHDREHWSRYGGAGGEAKEP